ncbi:MAG: hypothetical protein AAF639_40010 [Chloroflexota bacterium]
MQNVLQDASPYPAIPRQRPKPLGSLMGQLAKNDLKLIWRDRFLVFMVSFIVYIAIALRYILPWLNSYLAEAGLLPNATIPQSLIDFYPLIIAYFAIFDGALISGTVFGFALLDEKDDDTIKAMLVTPVPFHQYMIYRVIVPIIMAFVVVLLMLLVIGQSLIPLWQLVLISAGASLTAPIISLFYGIFAANKVQGFAMAKFVGVAGWAIPIGWFIAGPLQWLFGLFPPFLISKAYWMILAGDSLWWVVLTVGVVLQIGMIGVFIRWFHQVAYR